jgi:hypothetical protein
LYQSAAEEGEDAETKTNVSRKNADEAVEGEVVDDKDTEK